MTKDWMKKATMAQYCGYDIGCECYTYKYERELVKKFRRSARRTAKHELKKVLDKRQEM